MLMQDLFDVFTYYFNQYAPPVLGIACIVMGIIIICSKEKAVKLLGVSITASSLQVVFNSLFWFSARAFGENFIANFSTMNSLLVMFLSWCAFAALFMFVRFRYNAKFFYLFIMIGLTVLFTPLTLTAGYIWREFFGAQFARQYSYIYSILTDLSGISVAAVMFIIIFKNRKNEPDLNLLWFFRLLTIVSSVIFVVLNLIGLFMVNSDTPDIRDNLEKITLSTGNLFVFVMPALAIYVLVKGRRPSLEIV